MQVRSTNSAFEPFQVSRNGRATVAGCMSNREVENAKNFRAEGPVSVIHLESRKISHTDVSPCGSFFHAQVLFDPALGKLDLFGIFCLRYNGPEANSRNGRLEFIFGLIGRQWR